MNCSYDPREKTHHHRGDDHREEEGSTVTALEELTLIIDQLMDQNRETTDADRTPTDRPTDQKQGQHVAMTMTVTTRSSTILIDQRVHRVIIEDRGHQFYFIDLSLLTVVNSK